MQKKLVKSTTEMWNSLKLIYRNFSAWPSWEDISSSVSRGNSGAVDDNMSIGDKFVHVQVEDSGVDVHVTADISSTTTYRYSNRTSIDKDGAESS